MTAALEGGEWSAARPGRTLRPGKTRYPFCRRLGGLHGRSGRAEDLVPTGIWSRNVQPGSSVAIPTELPGPQIIFHIQLTKQNNASDISNCCVCSWLRRIVTLTLALSYRCLLECEAVRALKSMTFRLSVVPPLSSWKILAVLTSNTI